MKNFTKNFPSFLTLGMWFGPAVIVAVVVVGISCSKTSGKPGANVAKPSVAYTCVAGPDEQCASDLWYADYQRLKTMQQKYQAPQDQTDLMSGMATRLSQQIPPGYRWDEAKLRFVKLQPPLQLSPVKPVK